MVGKLRSSSLVSLAGVAFITLAACGGALSQDSADGGLDPSGSGTGAASSSGGGSGSGSGSGGASSSGVVTPGNPGSVDASAPPKPPPPPPPLQIPVACGSTICTAGQDCCGTPNGLTCVTTGTCGGLILTCTSSASCTGGQVCCINNINGGALPKVACQPTCKGPGGPGQNARSAQLCATDTECERGSCSDGMFGLSVCGF